MKIVSFNAWAVGCLIEDEVIDLSEVVPPNLRGTRYAVLEFIRSYHPANTLLDELAESGPRIPLADVTLRPPITSPAQVFAAPLNYRAHVDEMAGSNLVGPGFSPGSAAELGFFLKASGSIVGPADWIELPRLGGCIFHHEPELAVIIGTEMRAVPTSEALDYVFGYTCLLDITLRNSPTVQRERVQRKSYYSFTPLGPAIVTADEVGDPSALDIALQVNGQPRQQANTKDLICGVAELLSAASHVVPLQPGDVFATGTPPGVGPIVSGDEVVMQIAKVGELRMKVRDRSW